MIYILAQKYAPRLSYIADILFGVCLRTNYKLLYIASPENASALPSNAVLLNYTPFNIPDSIYIPQEKLLLEDAVTQQNVKIKTENDILKIWFSDASNTKNTFLDFDIFAAAFYLLSEYENYLNINFDKHGRYEERSNHLFAGKLHEKPWINIYAEWLWEKILMKNNTLLREKTTLRYSITFDIDSPFLYKHKSLKVQAGGFLKDILHLDFEALRQRVKVLRGEKDPYYVFDYILQKADPKKLIFFFLLDRNSTYDERFTYKNKAYRELIQKLNTAGAECGIHPSYTSFLDGNRIGFEKEKLEEITGKKVYSARMHFLKYRLPQTYQLFIQNTVTHDYTSCNIHNPGFRNFIASPFLWFDLKKNTVSNLTIHPTMFMDRTLQKYKQLSTENAITEICKLIDITAKYNGHFTALWHNSSLSEYKEWKGWQMVFEKTLTYLQQKAGSAA